MSPQKALQSIQGLLSGVASPQSFLAPSVHRGQPAAEDASSRAPQSGGVGVPVGYDVGETATN